MRAIGIINCVLSRSVCLYVWFVRVCPLDRQITQEQVLDILPLVTEVNAVSEELNKYQIFDVVLMTVAGHDGTTTKGTKLVYQLLNSSFILKVFLLCLLFQH